MDTKELKKELKKQLSNRDEHRQEIFDVDIEEFVIKFLNGFEVIEASATIDELEFVLIDETEENIQLLNLFVCTINDWATNSFSLISTELLSSEMKEFLEYCHDEGKCSLDLAYLVFNCLKINTDFLWFSTTKRKWMVRK